MLTMMLTENTCKEEGIRDMEREGGIEGEKEGDRERERERESETKKTKSWESWT